MPIDLHELYRVDLWVAFGFLGQALFTMRFLVQWVASEKQGRSVVPIWFWYFSLLGGAILVVYAVGRGDLVIALGQATGLFVYARNLMLIRSGRGSAPSAD